MDFSYSEEQQQIIKLVRRMFKDKANHEKLRALEKSGRPRFDESLWQSLAHAGLIGIAIPQEFYGAGLGFLELAAIIEQIGRATAPVPFIETTVLGALPIAEFGTQSQKELLHRVPRGDLVLTAALVESEREPTRPGTTARQDNGSWVLNGRKICVPAGQIAELLLVPAATGADTVGVFLVERASPGVSVTNLDTTSGQPEALIEFANVAVGADAVLGDPSGGAAIVEWMVERANAALCCLAFGVCDAALRLTAKYTKERKQFDVPIASFQAVGQRAADAYIDTEAIRLTSWQAAWSISAGLPAAAEVAVAKFWAAAGGQRVVHAAQHLHGGMGVDRDYPLHRYFLYAKQLELTLGGSTAQLRKLGKMLADEAA